MSDMTTASAREVQHELSAILDRVEAGEEITVTRRGKAIARIVPVAAKKPARPKLPDFVARMRELFPDGPPPGKPASEIIDEQRGR